MDRAFPDLRETQLSDELTALDDASEECREKVRQAVEHERQRVLPSSTVVVSPLSPSDKSTYATFWQRGKLSTRKSAVSACMIGT